MLKSASCMHAESATCMQSAPSHSTNTSKSCSSGFYGQLGHGNYEAQATPKQLCIGYQICIVSSCTTAGYLALLAS